MICSGRLGGVGGSSRPPRRSQPAWREGEGERWLRYQRTQTGEGQVTSPCWFKLCLPDCT
jgi:hypothetical protein